MLYPWINAVFSKVLVAQSMILAPADSPLVLHHHADRSRREVQVCDTEVLDEFEAEKEFERSDRVADDRNAVEERWEDYLLLVSTVSVQPRDRVGDIAEETLAEADTAHLPFLVISGRRPPPARKAIFGSSAQQILLSAQSPVVTMMSE